MIMYVPQLCGLSARYTPVALRQVYSRLTQRFYREMLPKALASRSILLSRLHCGEKSLLLVKLAPLGISIRAPTRSVLDGRLPGGNPDCYMGIGIDKSASLYRWGGA